jgi:hypothetical protein
MEFKFNVTGQERKSLVGAMSEILNTPTHYNGAPTFSYTVGNYKIDKNGTVKGEFDFNLFTELKSRGFEYEQTEQILPESPVEDPDGYDGEVAPEGEEVTDISTDKDGGIDTITIEYPLEGFTPETLDNLTKLVQSKEVLIKTALGANELPIKVLDNRIAFPWFKYTDNANLTAYAQFITALCQTAQEKKRVIAKVQESFENPRFAMRVWLIGLGMVGAEFSTARKILTKPLSGNGAWRYGKPTPASEEVPANV